ncbi:unnamed protein product [Amaranthus hypochondriacus]
MNDGEELQIRGKKFRFIRQMRTVCDVCETPVAVFFCPADEAALCLSCDHKVHTCNRLANRHVRLRLSAPKPFSRCDICENAPAFFYCEIDGTSLCLQCDMRVHVGGKRTHGRYLLFRQQVELPASISMDHTPAGRETNANVQSYRDPSSVLAPTPLGNEQTDRKMIDLNIKPHRLHDSSSNSQQ